jgi:hypothetical protein
MHTWSGRVATKPRSSETLERAEVTTVASASTLHVGSHGAYHSTRLSVVRETKVSGTNFGREMQRASTFSDAPS